MPSWSRNAISARRRLLVGVATLLSGCAATRSIMVVAVPVGDVRAHPQTIAHANVHDANEETQVLYGERVRLVQSVDGWASIKAIE